MASQGELATWSWNRPDEGSSENPETDMGKSPIGSPWDMRTSWMEIGLGSVEFDGEFVGSGEARFMMMRKTRMEN